MPKLVEEALPHCKIYYDRGKTLSAKAISLNGAITGLFSSWNLRHEFQNDSGAPIEAGYIFTLPSKTEFLGMNMRIGSRSFVGKVIERKDFRGYMGESLVDSIIRFDELSYGEYGANIGIISENETITVDLRFAYFLEYEKKHIRLFIPAWNLGACEVFDMSIELESEIARGDIHSPSHSALIGETHGNRKILRLTSSGPLDRDFILFMKGEEASSHILRAANNEDQVMVASFAPLSSRSKGLPKFLKFLVDCSGSMDGDPINEVKRGLLEAVRPLKSKDYVSYSRFGNEVEHLWRAPRPCDSYHMEQLVSAIERTEANMGGTNMEEALLSTYSDVTRTEICDLAPAIVLITDGQAGNPRAVAEAAIKSHNRIFAVGVGGFPDEAFLRGIAEKTGGYCEIAGSEKDIAKAIMRIFRQISPSMASEAMVRWPEYPRWEANIPYYLYAGETIHCFAGLGHFTGMDPASQPSVKLQYKVGAQKYEKSAGRIVTLENPDLVRFAYARLLAERPYNEQRQYLGKRFQLLTGQTTLILTEGHSDKFPESDEDFHRICSARSWNNRIFYGNDESGRRNAISHSGWIERQRNIARRLAKAGNK